MVGYEMQWTVRHFMHSCKKWAEEISNNSALKPGPRAYAERKKVMWQRMAVHADRAFKIVNNQYQSPL